MNKHGTERARAFGVRAFDCLRGRTIALILVSGSLGMWAGCAGEEPALMTAGGSAPGQAQLEKRLTELEQEINNLSEQTRIMREEVTSRLDLIDTTQRAMSVKVNTIKSEALRPRSALPAPNPSPSSKPPPARQKDTGKGRGAGNWFFRLALLVVILAALFFFAKIFFSRWGADEDGEPPTADESTTDLGRIRRSEGDEVPPEPGSATPPGEEPPT